MQKVQSYLYPNRVILLANLAGFTVENTIVYAKTVKIYNGVDNIIQFDIQNADQKRIDLNTALSNIELNVMDMAGNKLTKSPYTVEPTATTGIATVIIPASDLTDLNAQNLKYSVTATNDDGNTIMLYCDSRFSAVGTIQLISNAMPTVKNSVVYDRFSGEINFNGDVINHSSAIPAKFYEAVATELMNFEIEMTDYIGDVYLEATKDSTISVESFRTELGNAAVLASRTYTTKNSNPLTFTNISTEGWNYFRISWRYLDKVLIGVYSPYPTGTVDKVTVTPV
jgi:hypothetical protein